MGFPWSHSLEGNTAETNTILPVREEFTETTPPFNITVAADAAISHKNLSHSRPGHMHIVAVGYGRFPTILPNTEKPENWTDMQIITTKPKEDNGLSTNTERNAP